MNYVYPKYHASDKEPIKEYFFKEGQKSKLLQTFNQK